MLRFREFFFLCIYVLMALMGMTLIKMGVQEGGREVLHIVGFKMTLKTIIGIICYGFSFLIYIIVIAQMQISLAIPIAGAINSAGVVIIGLIIFHEHLRMGQAIGIAIVIAGVLIVGIFSR